MFGHTDQFSQRHPHSTGRTLRTGEPQARTIALTSKMQPSICSDLFACMTYVITTTCCVWNAVKARLARST